MTDTNITKENLLNYIKQYDFGSWPTNDKNINKKLAEMKNIIFQKLSQIFDECDMDKSTSLNTGKEASIFFKNVRDTKFELPSIFTDTKPDKNGVEQYEVSIDENKIKNYQIYDLASYLFNEDNNNKKIDSIGIFSYDFGTNNPDTLKNFDKYYEDNFFKYDEEKQNMLKKLRGMIHNNEISFEDGISNDKLKNLFSLSEPILKSLVNKELLPKEMKAFLDLDKTIVEHIQKNNFSDFKNLEKNFLNHEDILIIWDMYKNKNGISIYDDLIKKYENKNISKEQFIKNMKILLKTYNCGEEINDRYGVCGFHKTSPDSPYQKIYKKIRAEKFNLSEMKKFNFDKYIDESFINTENLRRNLIPQNEFYTYMKTGTNFNIEKSNIKKYLPKIEDNIISETLKEQTFNGEKFKINYDKNKIRITNNANENFVIDLKKLLKEVKDVDDKNILISKIKNLPAPVLIDLALEVDKIYVVHDSNINISGFAEDEEDSIILNLAQTDTDIETTLIHEIGHRLDLDKDACTRFEEQDGIWKKFEEVMDKIPEDIFPAHATANPSELFAEMYTLLNCGKCDGAYTISTYFEEFIEPIKDFIEFERKTLIKDRKIKS